MNSLLFPEPNFVVELFQKGRGFFYLIKCQPKLQTIVLSNVTFPNDYLQAQWLPSNDYEKYRTGVCIGNSMTDLEFIASSNELVTK